MKTYSFIHTADWHADNDPKKQEKLKASLDQLLDYVQSNKVDAIIHAGDIWEKKQSYADNSGVPMVIDYLRKLSKHVKFIFITKGNNSHDEPGSIALLHQLEPNIYAYEYPVSLAVKDGKICDLLRSTWEPEMEFDFIVSLVPYPTKSMFVKAQSIDLNNTEFITMFEQFFELIGDVTAPYNCPKLLAFHGNVVGSRLSSGQSLVSQDIMVAPSTLERAKADYYALGHIHLDQEIAPFMYYSGSIYNKNWGETEQKSFRIVTFNSIRGVTGIRRIELSSARPMVTVDAEFVDNDFKWDLSITDNDNNANAEFRFRCKVKENERNLITDDKIEWLKRFFGEDVKIEFNIVPVERESRSEQIMHCKSLIDEVKEYAVVTEQDINGTIEKKVADLQEVVS